jgi:hypothetical protein
MAAPLCGPESATGTKVAVGSAATTDASVAGIGVAVTTITCGVGVAPHADNINVNIRMVASIIYRAFFIQSPFLAKASPYYYKRKTPRRFFQILEALMLI